MIKPRFILLFTFFGIGFFISCNNDEVKISPKKNPSTIDAPKRIFKDSSTLFGLKLDFFKSIPDTISGCGEYFTYDTSKLKNDKYIFLSNLTDFAIIKISNQDIYLIRDSSQSNLIDNRNYIAVYEGYGYKAILKVTQIKRYDEGGYYSGTLQIIGNHINATFKVHGESGC